MAVVGAGVGGGVRGVGAGVPGVMVGAAVEGAGVIRMLFGRGFLVASAVGAGVAVGDDMEGAGVVVGWSDGGRGTSIQGRYPEVGVSILIRLAAGHHDRLAFEMACS